MVQFSFYREWSRPVPLKPFIISTMLYFIVLADRITKYMSITSWLTPLPITSFCSFTHVSNKGICWGYFGGNQTPRGWIILTCVIIGIICALGWHMIHQRRTGLSLVGEWLIMVGALSNLFDRIYYGAVIDFIYFFYKEYSFPVFNIADCCIVLGACIVILNGHDATRTDACNAPSPLIGPNYKDKS